MLADENDELDGKEDEGAGELKNCETIAPVCSSAGG
jgi:hypothetical protein